MSFFEKYPDIMISANVIDKEYRVRYTKVIEDFGRIYFETKQQILPKEKLQKITKKLYFFL